MNEKQKKTKKKTKKNQKKNKKKLKQKQNLINFQMKNCSTKISQTKWKHI
jgi:hypothetical protein